MSTAIAARIDQKLDKELNYIVKEEHNDKSAVIRTLLEKGVKEKLRDIALKKYADRKISIAKAAELADMALADFILAASKKGITMNYSAKELEKDFQALKRW